jgi:hypothetical protein
LPPEIHSKVFAPPSALNPSGHSRTPRRNKSELNAKRIHFCTEQGTCLRVINFLQIQLHDTQTKTLAISQ